MGIDEIIEIADDASRDTLTDPKTGQERLNREFVERSKIRIEARRFTAQQAIPEEYGEKREQPIQAVQIVLPDDYAKFLAPIKSSDEG
jgi:hypothetical protein